MGMNRTVIMKRWQINSLVSGSQLDELWALGGFGQGLSLSSGNHFKHLPNFSKPSWSHLRNGHNCGVNFIGICGKKWDNKCRVYYRALGRWHISTEELLILSLMGEHRLGVSNLPRNLLLVAWHFEQLNNDCLPWFSPCSEEGNKCILLF